MLKQDPKKSPNDVDHGREEKHFYMCLNQWENKSSLEKADQYI